MQHALKHTASSANRKVDVNMQILNQVRDHAGASGSQPFNEELINGTRGFEGHYPTNYTSGDLEAFQLLREYYRKPTENLKELVTTLYPHQNFTLELES
jgi:hypothetical protein